MSDLLSAASLLLAVVGVLYSLWYSAIADALATKVPEHAANRVKPRHEGGAVLCSKAAPLAFASTAVGLVFLPPAFLLAANPAETFERMGCSYISNYDPISTAFCLVVMFSLVLAGHSFTQTVRLILLLLKLWAQ